MHKVHVGVVAVVEVGPRARAELAAEPGVGEQRGERAVRAEEHQVEVKVLHDDHLDVQEVLR
eukprot:102052-Chlamydomonas_euryale.AAC.1